MDKTTIKNLVPMSREELKIRGLKNIRRANGFRQLHYVDGLGNEVTLIGDENDSQSFGMMSEKWLEYMKHNLNISYINQKRNSNDGFPCYLCRGENGHRINCPKGIAFSNR
jgi:hypothetical protein